MGGISGGAGGKGESLASILPLFNPQGGAWTSFTTSPGHRSCRTSVYDATNPSAVANRVVLCHEPNKGGNSSGSVSTVMTLHKMFVTLAHDGSAIDPLTAISSDTLDNEAAGVIHLSDLTMTSPVNIPKEMQALAEAQTAAAGGDTKTMTAGNGLSVRPDSPSTADFPDGMPDSLEFATARTTIVASMCESAGSKDPGSASIGCGLPGTKDFNIEDLRQTTTAPTPTDGFWGTYGPFGWDGVPNRCSRKCNKGKIYRVRPCLNRTNGGKPCAGPPAEFLDCSVGLASDSDACTTNACSDPCTSVSHLDKIEMSAVEFGGLDLSAEMDTLAMDGTIQIDTDTVHTLTVSPSLGSVFIKIKAKATDTVLTAYRGCKPDASSCSDRCGPVGEPVNIKDPAVDFLQLTLALNAGVTNNVYIHSLAQDATTADLNSISVFRPAMCPEHPSLGTCSSNVPGNGACDQANGLCVCESSVSAESYPTSTEAGKLLETEATKFCAPGYRSGPGSVCKTDNDCMSGEFCYNKKWCAAQCGGFNGVDLCSGKGVCSTNPATLTSACDCIEGFGGADCTTSLVLCGPGFTPSAKLGSCEECPRGTFKALPESAAPCNPCSLEGTVAEKTGSARCEPCAAGNEPNAAADECVGCPLGKHGGAGGGTCVDCASGYTTDAVGSLECLRSCPAGDERLTGCAAGLFQVGTGCLPCGLGKYNDVPGEGATCKMCNMGQYSGKTGSMTCTKCPSGEYTLSASLSLSLSACLN